MQFRTKARAVDLLGKGQIADLPTAITELWKNGYDAYADNLTAEIYLQGYKGLENPLFVITDDGKGMSRKDIFEKWLVLGTDSKSRPKLEDKENEETLWKKPRIKAGEKGIGRLSVAFLGSPMLMLTKKIGCPLQALFFDWRLLENYNLFLDDVNIPVEDIDDVSEFQNTLEKLKSDFLNNFDKQSDIDGEPIWEDSQEKIKRRINRAVKNIQLPPFFIRTVVADLLQSDDSHGTKFIIFNPIEQIIELIGTDEDDLEDQKFVLASLAGFTNEFKNRKKVVSTKIPVFKEGEVIYDLLNDSGNFFNYEDFVCADVLIEGKFDGAGSFNGKLNIYDEIIDYSYTNPRKKDSRNNYGIVPIKLGYSQGNQSESKLEFISWKKINDKVTNYGGLYIYRDNFRVLPYGRTDFDFLDFEKRRNLRIGTYYFSHRRMFGYLDISRDDNELLKDKSSREGLINNSAYRVFKDDIIAFFIDLAKEYFSDKPKQSIFIDKKSQIQEQHNAIKEDQKREAQEKREFSLSLSKYPERFDAYRQEYNSLIMALEEKTNASNIFYSDIESILDRIHTLDIEYKNLLPKIPKRYKPTETQLDRLDKYETKLIKFNDTIKKDSANLMIKVQEKLEIQELKKEFTKAYQKYNGTLERHINQNKQELNDKFENLKKEYSIRAKRILDELNFERDLLTNSISTKKQVVQATEKVNAKFEFLREQIDKELLPLVEHVKRLRFDIDEELLQGAYKAEYDNIKHQWEQTRETAQLGVAVEIIDHEFNHLYATINNSLERLAKEEIFKDSEQFDFLKKNLKQLEEKYDLLSPLYRISGVVSKEIQCSTIYEYLNKFFANKLKVGGVEITASKSFLNHFITIKEPVIHTVFINIINNALYWLRNSQEKSIRLDYWPNTEEILIINSGQKIEEHRLSKIFDLFYSNRPNGRGIGLFLAKESLNENYYDIYATNDKNYNQLKGACFVIKPLN
jgi:signal transduction histidine kinase